MIPLNAFPAIIRGRHLLLKTLSDYPKEEISKTIEIMEKYNHKTVSLETLLEEIRGVFPEETDLRKLNLLFFSLRTFYRASQPKIFPLRTRSGRIFQDLWDLKLHFYTWVQRHYGGFIPLEERERAMKAFSMELGIEKNLLESVLSMDAESRVKITRITQTPPKPQEVLGVSNFLLIEKALSISNYATIVFYGVDAIGTLAKNLIFRSKRSGLLLDFKVKDGKLICYLSGPYQIFKHPSPIYGEAIRYVLVGALAENEDWWLKACLLYTSPSPRDRG